MEIKQSVFAELDEVTPGHAILASNTSSLSITEMGDATLRPDKVVGFHFFYPASVMPLVEIIEGEDTSPRRRHGRLQLRPGDPQAADHLRARCPASSSTASSTPPSARSGARRRSRASRSRRSTRRSPRPTSRRWGRSSSSTCSASTRSCTSPSTCTSPTATASTSTRGCRSWSRTGKLGAKSGGDGLLQGRRAADRGRRRARRRGARRAVRR